MFDIAIEVLTHPHMGLQYPSWLVVEPYPSEKYESQLGVFFPIYGKIKMFEITNQPINHDMALW